MNPFSQTRAAPAANRGPRRRGVPTIYFRWAMPRRFRAGRHPVVRQWRDDLRVVPSFRRKAPSAECRWVREPVCKFKCDSQTMATATAKIGRHRGHPSSFRWALPRRSRVRCPLSFPMEEARSVSKLLGSAKAS